MLIFSKLKETKQKLDSAVMLKQIKGFNLPEVDLLHISSLEHNNYQTKTFSYSIHFVIIYDQSNLNAWPIYKLRVWKSLELQGERQHLFSQSLNLWLEWLKDLKRRRKNPC